METEIMRMSFFAFAIIIAVPTFASGQDFRGHMERSFADLNNEGISEAQAMSIPLFLEAWSGAVAPLGTADEGNLANIRAEWQTLNDGDHLQAFVQLTNMPEAVFSEWTPQNLVEAFDDEIDVISEAIDGMRDIGTPLMVYSDDYIANQMAVVMLADAYGILQRRGLGIQEIDHNLIIMVCGTWPISWEDDDDDDRLPQ